MTSEDTPNLAGENGPIVGSRGKLEVAVKEWNRGTHA